MKTIWKYFVPVKDADVPLALPMGGRIIEVGHGGAAPEGVAFWYEFEEGQDRTEKRIFRIFGTGHGIPPEYQHVGTVDLYLTVQLVWHLYERIR